MNKCQTLIILALICFTNTIWAQGYIVTAEFATTKYHSFPPFDDVKKIGIALGCVVLCGGVGFALFITWRD